MPAWLSQNGSAELADARRWTADADGIRSDPVRASSPSSGTMRRFMPSSDSGDDQMVEHGRRRAVSGRPSPAGDVGSGGPPHAEPLLTECSRDPIPHGLHRAI